MTGFKIVDYIRTNWAIADAKRDEGLTTPEDIIRYDDISYGPHGRENLLDIYMLKNTSGPQPTIVNIHGGGWVYGCKEIYQFYCMSLAKQGFVVVNINYRLAPESIFPAAIWDINAVLNFIATNGSKYYIDKDRLFLVGDSAGGQLVSHYTCLFTNPDFAALFDLKLPAVTIRAVGLNCGAYDGKAMISSKTDEVFNIYTGVTDLSPSDKLIEMVDTIGHMTKNFPPAFVMSSVCDYLLFAAKPMYERITSLGVDAELKIYGAKDRPDIGHVFHVNIKLEEARRCNTEECNFFKKFI